MGTVDKVEAKYFWPSLKKDVRSWAETCDVCQKSKAGKHINPPMDNRPVADGRLRDVQLDLVGPLTPSEGYTHLLTILDRAINHLTAVPLRETTAKSCVDAFMLNWYG